MTSGGFLSAFPAAGSGAALQVVGATFPGSVMRAFLRGCIPIFSHNIPLFQIISNYGGELKF
jgi:hypothetical protein